MIPQILSIIDGEVVETVLSQFAQQHSVDISHVIFVGPEKDELTVDQIHLMQKDIKISFAKKVLVALQGVDNSGVEVQNSLLKCLEEDADRIQFLLIVKNSNRLLPTILSRCSLIDAHRDTHKSTSLTGYEDIFSFKDNSDCTKEMAVEKIDTFISNSSLINSQILHHLLTIRKLIIDNNINPVLALDNILIFLAKTSRMKITHEK